jgi:hypothetical protein
MSTADQFAILDAGPSGEHRAERFADGVERLADSSGTSVLDRPRLLVTIAAAATTAGLAAIALGYLGVARSNILVEQMPYVVSGGILGLALVTIGVITLFGHWLVDLAREGRDREHARHQDHGELLAAIEAGRARDEELVDALRALALALDRQDVQPAQRTVRRAPRGSSAT